MNINKFGNATDEMIIKFEKQIGFELPKDYRLFLKNYNGGTPKIRYSTFWVNGLNIDIPLDVLYGLEILDFNLREWYEEYKDEMIEKTIIIGSDPGGGLLVLINNIDYGVGIYYWDHSYYFEKSNDNNNLYKIEDNFNAFIKLLKILE